MVEQRPWGTQQVLWEQDSIKIKKVDLFPEQRFSLHYHVNKEAHITVISGEGFVELDGDRTLLRAKDKVVVKSKVVHRITNTSRSKTLSMLELSYGEFTGEEDTIRLKDDYNR